MKKRSVFFLVMVVLAFQLDYSQNSGSFGFESKQKTKSPIIVDKDYFLLGTLSDYMGREKTYRSDDFVDNYYKGEYVLIQFIMKMFSDETPDFVVKKNQNHYNSIEDILLSKKIAEKINIFYNYKFEGGFRYSIDPKDKEWRKKYDEYNKSKEPKDTFYVGTMKPNLFKSELQKISFIVGAYSRFGKPNGSKYGIWLTNSASKYDYCVAVLKELKCENIEKKITENMIPTSQYVYFDPSPELKKYIDEYQFQINNFIEVSSYEHIILD